MATLPMRFRIIHYFSKVDEATVEQLMEGLRAEYGQEGQFNRKIFDEHIASMRQGGILDDRDVDLNDKDELVQSFAITDYGRDRLKYLPKSFNG